MTAVLLMAHAAYEQQYQDEADYARALEWDRRAVYARRHGGSLDGYEPAREFPCPGNLWREDGDGPIRDVCCDRCDFVTTVRAAGARAGQSSDW